jgi:hypothetical protein
MSSSSSLITLAQDFKVIRKVLSLSASTFYILLVLFVTFRLWNITTYSLWGGEAFTMVGAKMSWGEMFNYIVGDIVHPPLIYILLKLWIAIGGEFVLWLKLFPIIPSIAVVIPFLLLCRELKFSLPEINLALLLITVNGYLIHYAQELRMYSLFMFLAMCSFWLFMRYFHSGSTAKGLLILLTIVNLLTIYTHYYGWVVVGIEFLFLLLWRSRSVFAFALSMLFLLVCFAPWGYLVFQEARSIGGLDRNLDWIPKPGIVNIVKLYSTFNGPMGHHYTKLIGVILFAFPLLPWTWEIIRSGIKKHKDSVPFLLLAILSSLPVITLFLISQKMDQAVWIDRYFIFIAIPYLMLISAGVHRIKPVLAKNIWIGAIVVSSTFAGITDFTTNRMAWESPQLGSRVPWDGMTRQMMASEPKRTGPINIYTLPVESNGYLAGDWALSSSLDYFLDQYGDERFQFRYAHTPEILIQQVNDEYFWVGYFELDGHSIRPPAEMLTSHGYRIGNEVVFKNYTNRVVLIPVWKN